ncbi:T9SS type A sorting domain-containing protein [Polaribacter sp. Z022]|uniref:T9SS type A sorting domain-containing protein n=1 Tax=Polaribacter sp. Z022 TaxID=2927125 RepID=UPI002021FA1E|nr:T9SS type A sorting domain-containing protein [Polaribacter sp. Z022]MCL7752285.1 T9SS type A sorting domain-containing protein [Polaribacter sp. Z022]
MNKKLLIPFIAIITILAFYFNKQSNNNKILNNTSQGKLKPKSKPENARYLYALEREKYEFNMQKNPVTGEIPLDEKAREYNTAVDLMRIQKLRKSSANSYISRGPSNLGGRTRAFAVDISDATSNTMLSGGISSGLFRTTDGGASWTKVTPQGQIHNVSALAQDPRVGFQNIWYYATGEFSGNSASLGNTAYNGQGVWKSTDSGQSWTILPGTDSDFQTFDSSFDYTSALEVHPVTGDLFIATSDEIFRYDGVNFNSELKPSGTSHTDVVITPSGKVYVSFAGNSSLEGVWASPNGNGSWTQIAKNGTPADWSATGRIVLGEAASNDGMVYALYVNGKSGIEADLWQYNSTTSTWTNYSSKLPDEAGGDSDGNDPFAVQGGYDLVVSVKPDDENFVTIGGTNIYKIANITTDATFSRIGGYKDNTGYASYNNHHPDIHSLEFDPNNNNVFYSGTDGGIHKTLDITSLGITWISLNNNYTTYQYYHVTLDPLSGSNIVIGGAQDNGTTMGGTDAGFADNTSMNSIAGGDGVAVGIARRDSDTELQLFLGFQQGPIYTNYPSGYREITPTDAASGSSAKFVTYFYLDPDNNDLLYYGSKNTLFKTDDAANVDSDSWVNAGFLPSFEIINTIATTRGTYDASTSFMLVGGGKGGVFKVNDPKNATSVSTATNITPTGANTNFGTNVSDIAIHPTNPDIVLVTYANYGINNIYLTTNATSATPTWTLVERNLDKHSIRSAAITQVGSDIVYFVGTARGLYSSTDPTSIDWQMEGADDIGLALISGLAYRPADNKLLIGTHGNGMFETTVGGTLSTNDFNSNNLEVSFYPNPTQKELNLQSKTLDLSNNLTYNISDITGKTIKTGTVLNRKINVETLNSGVYLVNLSVNGKKQNFKFVKN